ncbi:MAG: hypothetical protein ACREQA_08945 [Candidatus Binatia bacterium]
MRLLRRHILRAISFIDRNGLYEETAKELKNLGDESQKTYGDLNDFVKDPSKNNANDLQEQYKELWTDQATDTGKQAAEDHYSNPLKKFWKWCKKLIKGDGDIPDPRPLAPPGDNQ